MPEYQCIIKGQVKRHDQETERRFVPPCVPAGHLLCRGCPGWIDMKKAMFEPPYAWNEIHCPAIGLTIIRK